MSIVVVDGTLGNNSNRPWLVNLKNNSTKFKDHDGNENGSDRIVFQKCSLNNDMHEIVLNICYLKLSSLS